MKKVFALVSMGVLAFGLVACRDSVKTDKVYYKDGKTLRVEYS